MFRFSFYRHMSGWLRSEDPPEIQEAISALERAPVLGRLSQEERRELAYSGHFRCFAPGEVIYHQGDPGLGMYLITRGTVELLVHVPESGPQDVATLGAGQFFGELTLFGPYRRFFTGIAVDEVHTLCLFRPDLEALRIRRPGLTSKFYAAMAEHLSAQVVALLGRLQELQGPITALQLLIPQ